MDLGLSEEQQLLVGGFERLFEAESSPARVRAAEGAGFDAALWKLLAETGALGLRVPEAVGGAGASLHDAVLVAEAAGRRLVSGPWREAIVAGGLVASSPDTESRAWLERLMQGASTLVFLPEACEEGESPLVPGGAVADACVALVGDRLVLLERPASQSSEPLADLAGGALGRWHLSAEPAALLAEGDAAHKAFRAAVAEWRLLTAAALVGLAREALEMAGRYATERVQFDRPIGAFQGVAHPLAESVADLEAARMLVWRAITAIHGGEQEAAARVAMAFSWTAETVSTAVARSLHTFGGYGLSLEYDIQLYHRRGKAWALAGGDPREAFLEVGDLLWGEEAKGHALPDAGAVTLDFELGPEAETMAARVRGFFDRELDDALRAHAHFSWDGHHPEIQRRLAEAGLLFPAWPEEYGGCGCGPRETTAVHETFAEVGWGRHAITTTQMVGSTLMRFANDALKAEVLPRIAQGEAICSLGYTEPEVGSDVAAARCRARREGDEWVIDGQKMFTSGANIAQYVFLLACTDPEARKRRGLTMFLVPTDTPGFEVQPLHTISDERTNATYYTGLRIPDRYRIGEVDGGWNVLGYALELEHGAGTYYLDQRDLLEGVVEWARKKRKGGRPLLEDGRVRERLARVAIHTEAAELLCRRSLWGVISDSPDHAAGPMAKFFATDHFIQDATDLMDLCAPDSLLQSEGGAGAAEFAYRLSTATSIYGGTSEIMKSLVAEVSLGMPRSRV